MSRSIRWLYYTRRQREVALGLVLGSSVTLGAVALQWRRPLLADGGSVADSKAWSSRQTIVSHNASLSERTKRDSGPQKIKVPSSISGQQPPPPQTKGHSVFDSEGDLLDETKSAWHDATGRVAEACDCFTGWDFATLRSKITSVIMPSWITVLPRYLDKLHDELSGAPWSLAWEIWEDAHDPEGKEISEACHVRPTISGGVTCLKLQILC